jgi:hypothetical protein
MPRLCASYRDLVKDKILNIQNCCDPEQTADIDKQQLPSVITISIAHLTKNGSSHTIYSTSCCQRNSAQLCGDSLHKQVGLAGFFDITADIALGRNLSPTLRGPVPANLVWSIAAAIALLPEPIPLGAPFV